MEPRFLYCVRHGQSTYNAEGRVQGQSDVPLSQLGRRQGEAVAQALASVSVDAIYSSPLRRAMETARAIARVHGLPIETDDRLKELHAGIFQDKLRTQLWDLYPEEMSRWTSGDPDFVIPGGESRRQLARRGCEALKDIAAAGHRHTVVVAHGRLLVVTLSALLAPNDGRQFSPLENGAISLLQYEPHSGFHLVEWNRVDHLAGVGHGGSGDL